MKIAIYQIAIERDENRLAFQSLNHIISVSNGRVPAELYDCVFAGEVSAQTLEDIFYVFNMEHPSGYKGRSLSVSDVVEIFLASGGSEFYYWKCFLSKSLHHLKLQQISTALYSMYTTSAPLQ